MNTIKIFLVIVVSSLWISTTNAQKIAHIIKQGENISSLARLYNVSIADIFKLNNLNDKTTLHIGQKIIIPNMKSAATVGNTTTSTAKVNVPKNQHQIVAGDNLLKIAQQYHVTTQQLKDWNNLKSDAIKAGDFLIINGTGVGVKATPQKIEPKIEETKTAKIEPTKKIESTPSTQETQKSTIKTQAEEKVVVPDVKMPVEATTLKAEQSYFQKQFASTKNELEGLCSTFKTIAGWHDGKYYVLLNNVEAGTIVKVSANNKSVYAKVLGALPNIKDDAGLIVRINSAAAAVLGAIENKFNAKIEF